MWFPGVHLDVGGGYPESESGLSKLSLVWMAQEARAAGILLDEDRLSQQLGVGNTTFARPDPCAKLHDSLVGVWRLAELVPRRYYVMGDAPRPQYRWKVPLGRRRFVADGSLVHDSVPARMECVGAAYHPANLPRVYTVVRSQ